MTRFLHPWALRGAFYSLLPIALTVLSGCGSSAKAPPPWTHPSQYDADLREWWNVYHVEVKGDKRTQAPVGYLYHQMSLAREESLYWVLDLDQRKRRGFLLSDYHAYQLVEKRDTEGKTQFETRDLGDRGLEGGVKAILGLNTGSVVLEKVLEQAEPSVQPPEEAVSPAD